MGRQHTYELTTRWLGNRGEGTATYRAYGREHEVSGAQKSVTIPGSADPAFRGDPSRWNPEELLVAAVSQCHMLAYLYQAALNGVVVTDYTDRPVGIMAETANGGGSFVRVTLHPDVTVASGGMRERAEQLHDVAHDTCFIAASVNFPVHHQATVRVQDAPCAEP